MNWLNKLDIIFKKNNVVLAYVYGSVAKGKESLLSDIDVAVFLDCSDHSERLELAAKLFHFAGEIDVEIEPKCFFWDEYNNCLQGSILSEILSTAIEVES